MATTAAAGRGARGSQVRAKYPAIGTWATSRIWAQDRGVADVESRTASGERLDVIDGEVRGAMGGASVARAPVAVLAAPGAEYAGAEPLPGTR